MNAIQNTIRNSEKVSPVSCYCKLSDLVSHLRQLSENKPPVRNNAEAMPVPIQVINSGYGVLMYVNR